MSQAELADAIQALDDGHRFHILFVKTADTGFGFANETSRYTTAVIDAAVRKPVEQVWTGDDGHWGAILDRIPYRPPDR